MFTHSLWDSHSASNSFFPLAEDISVDVAIIGGGITGITTALLLKKQGFKVAVLEAREVGKGTTGHSTGNLYVIIDKLLSPIVSKYDKEVLKNVISARGEAFRLISDNINQYNIDCDYKLQDMYVYEDNQNNKMEEEIKVARDIGLPFTEISSAGNSGNFPTELKKGMVIKDQATFNPLRYIQELARNANGGNCTIYENSKVEKIEETEAGVVLSTTRGTVTAKYAIHATHTPKGVEIQYHTVLGPYREYGVAVKIASNYPDGIYWGHYKDQKFSVRSYSRNGENYLLCIGKPHKVGQAEDNEKHIKELIQFLEQKFQVTEVTHKWGGQHYKPADYLPYIGRKSDDSNQLVATGFSTDGLIYGTLSGILLSDLIAGKENIYSEMFKASRHQPLKAAGEFLKENLDVAKEFIVDRFKVEDGDISELLPGEAKVLQKDGKKAAVYKSKEGKISITSAVCSHMGCIVHWNNAEETWDCPCHGSRFNPQGEVIEGPALHALKKINDNGKERNYEREDAPK